MGSSGSLSAVPAAPPAPQHRRNIRKIQAVFPWQHHPGWKHPLVWAAGTPVAPQDQHKMRASVHAVLSACTQQGLQEGEESAASRASWNSHPKNLQSQIPAIEWCVCNWAAQSKAGSPCQTHSSIPQRSLLPQGCVHRGRSLSSHLANCYL